MKTIIRLLIVASLFLSVTEVRAEKVKRTDNKTRTLRGTTAGCTPSSTFAWLNVNNARVRVNAGGDMWWDLPGGTGAKYYIPANGSATSLYAGSLWIAGLDINKQLKCAAIRFRQNGNDFWTGPLTIDGTASIDQVTCMEYDKMYNITRAEVDDFIANCDPVTGRFMGDEIPSSIANWPAHGDRSKGMSYYLAPFYDRDKDGDYNPEAGDYPYYDIDNELCHKQLAAMDSTPEGGLVKGTILADQVIKGDQTIWWVFNDKGNSHTETGGSAIGLEIRAQAFAFATNDEINNMTFYSYEIINRSTYTLTDTYFSPWTDVDLGFSYDDFVGCDVARGLGYGYNGNPQDGSGQPEAYGNNPPAVGVDFFQGPYLDPDGIDNPKYYYDPVTGQHVNCDESINGVNFGNGINDDERFGMRRFVYHDNTQGSVNGDPEKASEYYLLLRGIWKNGEKMRFGGNAVPGTPGVTDVACDFMFPFDSDPCMWGTGGIDPKFDGYWSEETGNNGSPNNPYDRRFMQSAGPFTLTPGAVNYITFGVPWARSNTGTPWASVELLRRVDDKCQAMFDNCFDVLDGPDAPDLTFRELDRQLIVYISNSEKSNNYGESYQEIDPQISGYLATDSTQRNDSTYRFEGYIVYQLANDEVSVDELNDITKARVVYQCDVENGVSTIINHVYNDDLSSSIATLMVEGADKGINRSFVITQDEFTTTGDVNLINHKTYYYMAIAYAYNNYQDYAADQNDPLALYGQKTPFLAGRKNIQMYSATPHKTINGTIINSNYGDKPQITRWTGLGNGGNQVELSDKTVNEILSKKPASEDNKFGSPDYPIVYHPTYKAGNAPVDVKIIDPLNVVSTDYAIWFEDFNNKYIKEVTGDKSVYGDSVQKTVFRWVLKDLNSGEMFYSDTTSDFQKEQIFIERGISVTVYQPWDIYLYDVGDNIKQTVVYDYDDENPGVVTDTIVRIDTTSVYKVLAPNTGLITTSVTFADSSNKWLSGIRDDDNVPSSVLNWIRSGTYADQDNPANNDKGVVSTSEAITRPSDPSEAFEMIADGSWAPYYMVHSSMLYQNAQDSAVYNNLGSIDIVLTADKSQWTRCAVVEMCDDEKVSQGGAPKYSLRRAPSVDKNGKPYEFKDENGNVLEGEALTEFFKDAKLEDLQQYVSTNESDANYISPRGMGWFPGYVIDVETGARLNLCFGEDTFYPDLNGCDMLFNPPALKEATALSTPISQTSDPVLFDPIDGRAVLGGKHFVYVFPMQTKIQYEYKNGVVVDSLVYKSPAYDAGSFVVNNLMSIEDSKKTLQKALYTTFWKLPVWMGMPMAVEGKQWLQEGNPVKISVRMAKPYKPGYAYIPLEVGTDELYDEVNHKGYLPYYTFTTIGAGPTYNDPEKAKSDLDMVTVVPNPYYAFSTYEDNALTHKVKIANLPDKCVVTIYTVNGVKIRQFKKDSVEPSVEWDLTNHANTPIASGFYIIHVKDNTTGNEKTVKFYAAMRQVDLNTF